MVCKAHQGLAFAHLNSPLFQNERCFLMQTTFKVFIEFFFFYHIVSVYVLVFWPQGISSPTWDQTCTSCIGRRSHNHWTTSEVPVRFLLSVFQPHCPYFTNITPTTGPLFPLLQRLCPTQLTFIHQHNSHRLREEVFPG